MIWAARFLPPLWPPGGRWPEIRPSHGRSRLPAVTAAPATRMVVHWPKRIKAKGDIRSQFHHVIDIAPTILEAASLPEPTSVNGTASDSQSRA